MLKNKKKLTPEQKRKVLLVLRTLLLAAAALYLIFTISHDYSPKNEYKIYFSTSNAAYIKAEKRIIESNEKDLYQELFLELKAGPKSKKLRRVIPEGSKLINYSLKNKKLTLNFNAAFRDNHWGGSTGEIMTVYSVVNTFTDLKQVDQIKFLIENKEIDSLVGHLDLSQPLIYNQKLVESK